MHQSQEKQRQQGGTLPPFYGFLRCFMKRERKVEEGSKQEIARLQNYILSLPSVSRELVTSFSLGPLQRKTNAAHERTRHIGDSEPILPTATSGALCSGNKKKRNTRSCLGPSPRETSSFLQHYWIFSRNVVRSASL